MLGRLEFDVGVQLFVVVGTDLAGQFIDHELRVIVLSRDSWTLHSKLITNLN
jgi:hypothetical protein